ncbi:hypothetical protein [Xylophilus ampelinus]|uniref:DUF4935 domain-containing protein n=1 Tax=Xylophilus ampelinus TaxID=54067 RepID=A0A318SI03_9BURK|nr:hypothetical protein [Xylophilus ampelinus]MCS4509956.1 hypothetical protein [Xylophilus ampelinus]PYE78465.1 hypothetical protein DFQ15_107115 [Xylophilus ampelinus]
MDVFHVVIDTSMMRAVPFQHADFVRLLKLAELGKVKIYFPRIALEEERTAQLKKHEDAVIFITQEIARLQRGTLGMLVEGLPLPGVELWDLKAVTRNSAEMFGAFVAKHKIEVIEISMEHAVAAWARYFDVKLPFDATQVREERRKDIPDSWILEGGRELKRRTGVHCALVRDKKLADAFRAEGFQVYDGFQRLLDDVEAATAVEPIKKPADEEPPVPLDQLRGPEFSEMDVLVLGMIEALNTPSKNDLLAAVARAGYRADIAEHEARTLVLAGRLTETATHFIPTSRALAKAAAGKEIVTNALLKIV